MHTKNVPSRISNLCMRFLKVIYWKTRRIGKINQLTTKKARNAEEKKVRCNKTGNGSTTSNGKTNKWQPAQQTEIKLSPHPPRYAVTASENMLEVLI